MFEIHLTIDPEQAAKVRQLGYDVTEFVNLTRAGGMRDAVVTAHYDAIEDAKKFLEALEQQLARQTVATLRRKIECAPRSLPDGASVLYVETHMKIFGNVPGARAGNRGLLFSIRDDGQPIVTVRSTVKLRDVGYSENFLRGHVSSLNGVAWTLSAAGVQIVGDAEHELVILDDNREHDSRWEDVL